MKNATTTGKIPEELAMPSYYRSILKDILWAVALAGLTAAGLRFWYGLGATTGLNDTSPWGIWIAFKLVFVALAGGGFTLAALVYIFHLERYRPLLRRAILMALLGYGSFILSLLLDLGLPWHIYMPVIHWQHHSVMFEIAWCVLLYFSVLVMEFSPVILEHPFWQHPVLQRIAHLLHKLTLPLVIAGIVLSTLHQSSLGALFLMMPHRVHPLWYSPLIPPMFFISAIAAGLAALIVESFLADRLFGLRTRQKLLAQIGRLSAGALWIYLVLRLSDLVARGVLPGAVQADWQSGLFLAEIILGGILPGILYLLPAVQRNRAGLLSAAILVVSGIASQRMSLSLFTMWRPDFAPYNPSGLELLIAFGVPAAAGLVYLFFSEQLAVFQAGPVVLTEKQPAAARFPTLEILPPDSGQAGLFRRSLVGVGVVALILAFLPAKTIRPAPVAAARGWENLIINGNRNNELVIFPHSDHQSRLSESAGNQCQACHHLELPQDQGSACANCHQDAYQASSIFSHTTHVAALGGNTACRECHPGGNHTRAIRIECQSCHPDMMELSTDKDKQVEAPGYFEAMHGTCLDCHTEQAEIVATPELGECETCHATTLTETEFAQNELSIQRRQTE